MTTANRDQNPSKRGAKVWFFLSVMLSLLIVGWAFSLPFRNETLTFAGADPASEATDQREASAQHELPMFRSRDHRAAQEFRDAAMAMDEEFMRQRREANRRPQVPGRELVQEKYNRYVESVKQELKLLGEPEEGTLEWKERKRLLETLEDAPQ